MENSGNIIIYQTEDGLTKLDVQLHDETVWLSQQQMAELFHSSRINIVEHIMSEIPTGPAEGNRMVSREIPFYNLDMIISLGYRVHSIVATNFRIWATQRLKEYIIDLEELILKSIH